MSAPGDYRDLRSGPVQARRQVAADRAGAKNADLHRCPLPAFHDAASDAMTDGRVKPCARRRQCLAWVADME